MPDVLRPIKEKITPRTCWLVAVFAALICIYGVFFAGWFRTQTIGVAYRLEYPQHITPIMTTRPVVFALDGAHEIRSIRVLGAATANQAPVVMWELEGRSEPMRSFKYGQFVSGMQTVVLDASGVGLRRLEPGVDYTLEVRAKGAEGVLLFQTRGLQNK